MTTRRTKKPSAPEETRKRLASLYRAAERLGRRAMLAAVDGECAKGRRLMEQAQKALNSAVRLDPAPRTRAQIRRKYGVTQEVDLRSRQVASCTRGGK